eukprot:m.340966 g.340966  ORF g.340966 m.340966 type:complete len:336 (+) comp19664_c0_seq1:266-1273(+)
MSRPSTTVFVGNIPYEATEEQLMDHFSSVGPVVNFRLMTERETGKPKGYGFCDYKDPDTAVSAMRNLNNSEFHGRKLKVDSAALKDGGDGGRSRNNQGQSRPPIVPQMSGRLLEHAPQAPYNAGPARGQAIAAIHNTINNFQPEEMYKFMTQIKMLIENQPEEASKLLHENPQLCYALVQAQLRMGMIDRVIADALMDARGGGPAPGILPGGPPPAIRVPDRKRAPAERIPPADRMDRSGPPPRDAPLIQDHPPVSRRPQTHTPAQPPPQQQPQQRAPPAATYYPPTQAPVDDQEMQKRKLLEVVLKLTEADLAKYTPEQAEKMRALKRQYQSQQ